VLVGQHRGMDWSVGGQLVARYTRQTLLVVSYSSTQPTVAPRRRCDVHDMATKLLQECPDESFYQMLILDVISIDCYISDTLH